MHLDDTPHCWNNHLGLWCVEALWFTQAVAMFRAGVWAFQTREAPTPVLIQTAERRPYDLTPQGTAIIPLMGPLTKGGSFKFEGTSTVRTRRMLRMAVADEEVGNILLHIDSPGGHVAGIEALAADVASIRGRKPIVAHIDDLGASAAYWVASQADSIAANATSEIGSIGTMAVVEDTSGRMDRLGIKVHVVSTGLYKGIGAEGAPVSDTALAYIQERVNAINAHFLSAVQRGRRFTAEQVASIADGRVHIAAQAQAARLIDRVQSLDETLAQLSSGFLAPARPRATRAVARLARAQVAFLEGGRHASP